jgi:4-hydroxy-4-methyl-2-oxoglutarate aldolase
VAPGPLRAAPLRARCPQGRGAQVTLAGARTRPPERPHQAILVLAPVRPLRELPPRPPDHDIVDAMGRLHRHCCHILDLVSPTPGRVLFGPAVTISYYPSCSAALDPERYNLANLFYEAVGDDPDGKVVVLASNGYTEVSMGGGTKLLRLQEHGCAGVLTDGRLRDFDELARYDFAAYCSGEATHWGGDQVTPFQANVPVVVSGVGVMPGNWC